jgi:hypothetical protein
MCLASTKYSLWTLLSQTIITSISEDEFRVIIGNARTIVVNLLDPNYQSDFQSASLPELAMKLGMSI